MQKALILAQAAGEAGEVPVGAIIVREILSLEELDLPLRLEIPFTGKGRTMPPYGSYAIAAGENRRQRDSDPTAHAEIMALRKAGKALGSWYLNQCTLYVTLEPCPMCAGAIIQSRLGLLVYGASEPKSGAIRTVMNLPDSAASNHRLEVISGILESDCQRQLQSWFESKRGNRETM